MNARDRVTEADLQEIEALYPRQSRLIDEGDAPGWAATFTTEGVFESPTHGSFRGRVELVNLATALNDGAIREDAQYQHRTSEPVVTAGGGELTVRCDALLYRTSGGTTELIRAATYEDRLEREDGQLKVARRRVSIDGVDDAHQSDRGDT